MTVINTINQKFTEAYNALIKNNKPEDMSTLFDDGESVIADEKKDELKNKSIAKDIREAAKADKNNKAATQLAADKADKLNKKLKAKKEAKFMGYEIKSAKAKGNVTEISVNVDGKKCKGTISYAKDGSCVMELNTGKETITKVADKDGVVREKIVKDKKTGKSTASHYDAKTGKINEKCIAENGAVTTIYYDDNGQATKKVKNDGVNTTASLYEYDKNGNKVGTYAEIVNNTTKEKTIKTTLTDPKKGTRTSTETKPDGTVTVRTSKKNKDGKWEIQTKEVTNKDNKTTKYEYSNVKYNKDGTSTRDRKVTTSGGKVYYEVQTLNKDGDVVNTKRYSDEKHEKPVSEKELKYDKKGHHNQTVQTVKDKDGKTQRTVETQYDVQTGKPSKKTETSFGTDGKQTGTKEYNYENGILSSSTFKFKDDAGKDITENRTYFEDGSEKTITNETYGFTITKNTKGAVTQIEFKDAKPDNVTARIPQNGAANGSIPLFNSEGVLIGNADYDAAGKFQKIDWKNGFGPAATDTPAAPATPAEASGTPSATGTPTEPAAPTAPASAPTGVPSATGTPTGTDTPAATGPKEQVCTLTFNGEALKTCAADEVIIATLGKDGKIETTVVAANSDEAKAAKKNNSQFVINPGTYTNAVLVMREDGSGLAISSASVKK